MFKQLLSLQTPQVFAVALLCVTLCIECSQGYSALQDIRAINEYKNQLSQTENKHAKVARTLVNQANWASVGTISTNKDVLNYPMVNIISIDDRNEKGTSTGKIHFLLTDLDFTGPDWRQNNKVTFLFTDEQPLNCKHDGKDPMEPTCARTIISGKITEMDKNAKDYANALASFKVRHPAAKNWMKAHSFYLCELNIENIFVLDFYGGPHKVTPEEYYAVEL